MKCERCNGDGEIEINTHQGEEGMKIEMDIMVVCPDCDGKGIVPDEENDES